MSSRLLLNYQPHYENPNLIYINDNFLICCLFPGKIFLKVLKID